MNQRKLVDPVPWLKAWTSKRSDPFKGNYTTEQVEGMTSHGLPYAQSTRWGLHSQCRCMCKQVVGVVPEWTKHIIAGSKEGHSAGAGRWNFMGVSDGGVSWQNVLSD